MADYPPGLVQRFAHDMQQMQAAIKKLQSRTIAIDSGAPLAVLPAVIDPTYAGTADPMAYINGSGQLTGPYSHLASYTPVAGDAVLVIPTPVTAPSVTAYVILGKLL